MTREGKLYRSRDTLTDLFSASRLLPQSEPVCSKQVLSCFSAGGRMDRCPVRVQPPATSSRKPRASQSSDRELSQAERNVVSFIKNSQAETSVRPIVRSNSYTIQDVDKQRLSIQASLEACDMCDDDPNYRYFHSLSTLKGRRMSKSLPELNHLRHFPLVNTRYTGDEDSEEEDDDEKGSNRDIPEKTAWAGKSDFMFTGIVLALGLNNLWRFPYFCYRFHAGSFLFAFVVSTMLIGLPFLSMEYALGQLTRRGPIAAFGGLCPLLKGVSIASAFVALISAPLYATINSWSLFYFFKSFYASPLWSLCGNSWNSDYCSRNGSLIPAANGSVGVNETAASSLSAIQHFPTQEFFDRKLLELTVGPYSWGQVQWELIIFVFATWVAVFVTLRRTILFSSHPSSCFSLMPYAILIVLFARSLMFEGAKEGVIFFMKPEFNRLLEPQIWTNAIGLSLHSLGCVLGISFAKATCNRERNNFLRDAFVICFINVATVIFIGLIVFSTLGNLSQRRKIPISQVLIPDAGVSLIAFSELLSSIPFTAFWSVVFYFTLFCLGCDYQISMIRSFLVAIEDAYGSHVKRNFLAHQIFTLIVCVLSFVLSLVFLTQQGLLLIQIFDHYVTVLLTIVLALCEVMLMGWFYGGSNLAQVIKLKISKALGCFFPFAWNFLTPALLIVTLVANVSFYEAPLFRGTEPFPHLIHVIILGTAAVLLLLIPVVAYHQITRTPRGNFFHRIASACKPFEQEGRNLPLVHDVELMRLEPSSDRRPSILPMNWSRVAQDTRHEILDEKAAIAPITLSLIQGLDRETDL